MTGSDWMVCEQPTPMLLSLRGRIRWRKLLLFACACGRRIWHLMPDARSRNAVEACERFVEGEISDSDLKDAAQKARQAAGDWQSRLREVIPLVQRKRTEAFEQAAKAVAGLTWPAFNAAYQAANGASLAIKRWAQSGRAPARPAARKERFVQSQILRDIVGKPFRPLRTVDPTLLQWEQGTIRHIAQGIYDERAFDRLPILGDALMDAGCEDEEILLHCRAEGPHVRGCWLLDLLLDKDRLRGLKQWNRVPGQGRPEVV